MQLSAALNLFAILSTSASVLAMPAVLSESRTNLSAVSEALATRAAGVCVYFCTDKDFTGTCVNIVQPLNDCSCFYLLSTLM